MYVLAFTSAIEEISQEDDEIGSVCAFSEQRLRFEINRAIEKMLTCSAVDKTPALINYSDGFDFSRGSASTQRERERERRRKRRKKEVLSGSCGTSCLTNCRPPSSAPTRPSSVAHG